MPESATVDKKPKGPVDKTIYPKQVGGAIQYRNKNDRIKRWKDYARIISHNYLGDNSTDSPVVNIMAARARGIGPQLAFNDPVFDVSYVGGEPNPNSPSALAIVLGQVWVDENVSDVFKRGIDDWPTFGRGIYFVGFEAAGEGEILDSKRALADARETVDKQQKGRGVVDKIRGMFQKDGKAMDPPSEVRTLKMMLQQRIFVERVSPFDFVIDPCATSHADATFMARRMFLPLERAKLMFGADCPVADSIANVAVYTSESDADPWGNSDSATAVEDFPESVRRVEVWENWNIVTRETCYIDKAGKVLGDPEDWKSPYPGWPFVLLDWDTVPDCPYPEGVCAALHTLNNELNEMRKRELAEMGKAFRRYRVPNTISQDSEKALKEGGDGECIKMAPDETIDPLIDQPLPADLWGLENRIMANMDEVSRTNAQMGGGMNPTNRSATEVATMSAGTDATMNYRQLQVESAAAQIAERMSAVIFATYDEEVVVRIQNQDPDLAGEVEYEDGEMDDNAQILVGEMIDYPFIGVDHAGFVRVKVTAGSMASVAKDVERNQAGTIMQLYGAEPWFDKKAFALHHMSMFPSIKDPSRFVLSEEEAPEPEIPEEEMPVEGEEAMQQGAPMPPAPEQGMDLGIGSGQPQADLLAATMGGTAPGAGVNGYPGPMGPPM